MSITAMSRRRFRVLRRGATVLATTAILAAHVIAATPLAPAFVEVTLVGAVLTGTVSVSGLVDGVPTTQVLEFAGPLAAGRRVLRTTRLFSSITGITSAGLHDEAPPPTIAVRFVSEGNHAVPVNTELATGVAGMIDGGEGYWAVAIAGGAGSQPTVIGHDDVYGFQPRRGDLYIEQRNGADYRTWEVIGTPDELGDLRRVHWELKVEERQNADLTTA